MSSLNQTYLAKIQQFYVLQRLCILPSSLVALHEKCTDDTVAFIVPATFYCICFQTCPRNVTER